LPSAAAFEPSRCSLLERKGKGKVSSHLKISTESFDCAELQEVDASMTSLVIQGVGPFCPLQVNAILRMPPVRLAAYKRIHCVSSGCLAAAFLVLLRAKMVDGADLEALFADVVPSARAAVWWPPRILESFLRMERWLQSCADREPAVADAAVFAADLRVYSFCATTWRRNVDTPRNWRALLEAARRTASIPPIL
jgi:hypothetical protein